MIAAADLDLNTRASFTLHTGDRWALHAQWSPNPQARGVLVLSHGLGEHCGAYDPLSDRLAAASGMVSVLGFDYRGHGRSPGRRGVVRRYDDFVTDLRAAVAWCQTHQPDLPIFILGHSNGGQVALRAAVLDPGGIAGLVLSNPALRLLTRVSRWTILAGQLCRRVAPWVTFSTTIGTDQLSHQTAGLEDRLHDPLRHGRVGPALYFGMIQGGETLIAHAPAIHLPTLLLLGEADPIVDPAASREFFDQLGSRDKTLRVYPQALHEPLNDLGRDAVVADLETWLAQHLHGPVSAAENRGWDATSELRVEGA